MECHCKKNDLAWKQEYAMESLWHEILHNRQVLCNPMKQGGPAHVCMEVINHWYSKSTYPKLLKALGASPVHQASIIIDGLGYGNWVRNFDNLLRKLSVQDSAVLDAIGTMHQTKTKNTYITHLTGILKKEAPTISEGTLQELLQGLKQPSPNYEELLSKLIQN